MSVCPRCGCAVDLADEDVACNVYGLIERHPGCTMAPADPAIPEIDIAPAA